MDSKRGVFIDDASRYSITIVVSLSVLGLAMVLGSLSGNWIQLSAYSTNSPPAPAMEHYTIPALFIGASSAGLQRANATSLPIKITAIQLQQSLQPNSSQLYYYTGATADVSGAGGRSALVMGNFSINSTSVLRNVTILAYHATLAEGGATYQGYLPNGTVTAHFYGNRTVGVWSSILLYMSVAAVPYLTLNTIDFEMLPSLAASVAENRLFRSPPAEGSSMEANGSDMHEFLSGAANVTISSGRISVSGNTTTLSATVKDNSNRSVILQSLLVLGPDAAAPTRQDNRSGYPASINLSASLQGLRTIGFVVSQNGTLAVPAGFVSFLRYGYTIGPGGTVTLGYSGNVVYGEGGVAVRLLNGSNYTIYVAGTDGASALLNTSAT